MKLPNGENALIPMSKIERYLLSGTHTVGRTKARFFQSVGYQRANPSVLASDLRSIARTGQVSDVVRTRHGAKYVVDGDLLTPSGSGLRIRTVWIVEAGSNRPRLVTAYPA